MPLYVGHALYQDLSGIEIPISFFYDSEMQRAVILAVQHRPNEDDALRHIKTLVDREPEKFRKVDIPQPKLNHIFATMDGRGLYFELIKYVNIKK